PRISLPKYTRGGTNIAIGMATRKAPSPKRVNKSRLVMAKFARGDSATTLWGVTGTAWHVD
ncbi:MAG: hypothetical protein ACREMY_13475, partial [bacterium]